MQVVIVERGCAQQSYQHQALVRGKWRTVTTVLEEVSSSSYFPGPGSIIISLRCTPVAASQTGSGQAPCLQTQSIATARRTNVTARYRLSRCACGTVENIPLTLRRETWIQLWHQMRQTSTLHPLQPHPSHIQNQTRFLIQETLACSTKFQSQKVQTWFQYYGFFWVHTFLQKFSDKEVKRESSESWSWGRKRS